MEGKSPVRHVFCYALYDKINVIHRYEVLLATCIVHTLINQLKHWDHLLNTKK